MILYKQSKSDCKFGIQPLAVMPPNFFDPLYGANKPAYTRNEKIEIQKEKIENDKKRTKHKGQEQIKTAWALQQEKHKDDRKRTKREETDLQQRDAAAMEALQTSYREKGIQLAAVMQDAKAEHPSTPEGVGFLSRFENQPRVGMHPHEVNFRELRILVTRLAAFQRGVAEMEPTPAEMAGLRQVCHTVGANPDNPQALNILLEDNRRVK